MLENSEMIKSVDLVNKMWRLEVARVYIGEILRMIWDMDMGKLVKKEYLQLLGTG